MQRVLNILRLLLVFAACSATLPGLFCAVATAGCGDYLHTKLGPPASSSSAAQLAARPDVDSHTVALTRQPDMQHPAAVQSGSQQPVRPCTGWQCRQRKTPWLPAPPAVPATSLTADAVLTGPAGQLADIPTASRLCTPAPLPAHSVPPAVLEYPPECCTAAV